MKRTAQIHGGKTPVRIHYIAEWAAKREVKQADIVVALGADKATVSRWFSGRLPEQPYLFALADFFAVEEPNDLFHHPDDNWLTRRLRHQTADERERMHAIIENAFPEKKAAAK